MQYEHPAVCNIRGLDLRLTCVFTGEQVIKSKTENGFVPNGATGGGKSQDRTEPMMGAKVLLEMYLLR